MVKGKTICQTNLGFSMNIRNHPYHQKGEFLIDTQLQMDFLKNITWILYFDLNLTLETLFCSSLVFWGNYNSDAQTIF